MQGKTTLTQTEVLSQQLVAIAVDVTRADRKAFIDKHNYSKTTLSNYLSGTVHDNDTAVLIINFMRQRIDDRYKAISH